MYVRVYNRTYVSLHRLHTIKLGLHLGDGTYVCLYVSVYELEKRSDRDEFCSQGYVTSAIRTCRRTSAYTYGFSMMSLTKFLKF